MRNQISLSRESIIIGAIADISDMDYGILNTYSADVAQYDTRWHLVLRLARVAPFPLVSRQRVLPKAFGGDRRPLGGKVVANDLDDGRQVVHRRSIGPIASEIGRAHV